MAGHQSLALLLATLISSWPKASWGATGNGSIISVSNSSGNNYAFTSEHTDHSDHNANDSMEYDAESVALERIVSTIVPVFFGIIGFAGLLGNGLVILGKWQASLKICLINISSQSI